MKQPETKMGVFEQKIGLNRLRKPGGVIWQDEFRHPLTRAVLPSLPHTQFQISATIIEQTAPTANTKWRDLRDV